MDILKDRAIWIVVVVMFIAGAMYMVIVDPSRVDKMDNIVERDDERIADVTETNELIDRIDKKLNYNQLKFYGRIPSVFFSFLTIFITFKILYLST